MKLFQRLWMAWENFQALWCYYLGRNYRCGCGHTAKWKTAMTIHGRSGVFRAPSKNPDYCPECWAKAAVRCAWCGEPILPGNAITLYIPKEGFEIPDHAVVYKREPRLQLVGCLGWNCADTVQEYIRRVSGFTQLEEEMGKSPEALNEYERREGYTFYNRMEAILDGFGLAGVTQQSLDTETLLLTTLIHIN